MIGTIGSPFNSDNSVVREKEGKGAVFSKDAKYRYLLWRNLVPIRNYESIKALGFIMLNPSTATHIEDDPTIRKCMGFGRRWKYERIIVANIFGYRSTYPKELKTVKDPVGSLNDSSILTLFNNCHMVIAAWGTHGHILDRQSRVAWLLKSLPLHHLGLTQEGYPKHPLYLKNSTRPIRWK